MDEAALDAAAGQPGRERPGVMLAALGVGGVVERRPAKLRRPDDERVVEHAAAFQVLEQAGDRPIDVLASGAWCAIMSPCASQLLTSRSRSAR